MQEELINTEEIEEIEEAPGDIEKPEITPEPEKPSIKKPRGFPQKKWDSWSDSAKQNYINVIKASNKLTGRSDL